MRRGAARRGYDHRRAAGSTTGAVQQAAPRIHRTVGKTFSDCTETADNRGAKIKNVIIRGFVFISELAFHFSGGAWSIHPTSHTCTEIAASHRRCGAASCASGRTGRSERRFQIARKLRTAAEPTLKMLLSAESFLSANWHFIFLAEPGLFTNPPQHTAPNLHGSRRLRTARASIVAWPYKVSQPAARGTEVASPQPC